jgi:hypothetical protein
VISNVSVPTIGETTATITWTTDIDSDSKVYYGTTPALGSTKSDSNKVTNHNIVLTGLTQNTKYYFKVESTDDSETSTDDNGGAYYTFTTLAPTTYSISLSPTCGVCGELYEVGRCNEIIEATAVVAAAGTYHVCWDTQAEGNVVGTFTASGPGIYSLTFYMPEAKKGSHTVYLTDSTYTEKASTVFTVSPSVKMSPEKGPVDTTVSFNGYGFDASQQIQVSLFQGDVAKGETKSATADATKGSWTVSYTIPATPAGHYVFKIQAKEGTDWPVWVVKSFEVTPKITSSTDRGTVGQTVEIKGSGFGKDETGIAVTFDGETRAANIHANENGSWQTNITIPPRQSGTYAIDASGTRTRARDVPDVAFILSPGILLEPNLAYVGDTITVRGGGFRSLETGIEVSFGGQVRATVTAADLNGCWETSFVVPPSHYGANTVSAQGDVTAPVENTLTVKAKIEAVSPTEGAPGDSISLTGTGFSASKKITVTVGGVAATENMQTQYNGDVIITFRVPKGSVEGMRTLVVTDEGGATDSVEFTVKKKTLSTTPLPISPQDSTLRSGMVTFKWQGVTGGTGFTYTLEISKPGGAWSKSGITQSTYALTEEEALPKGAYTWRVKIVDDYGNESAWSEAMKFTVSPIPTWVWVVIGLVVLLVLMVVAYRETKFKVTE